MATKPKGQPLCNGNYVGRGLLLLTAILPAVSCEAEPPPSVEIDTVSFGDTTWVSHSGHVQATDTLILDLQIGGLEGRDGFAFGDIQEIEPTQDGGVLVFDYFPKQVYKFGPDGHLQARIGGLGQGPGEYQMVNGLAVLNDGRIAVRSTRKITLYTVGGDYLEDWPIRVGFLSDGMLTGERSGMVVMKVPMSDLRNPFPFTKIGFLRLDADGSVLDTLGPITTPWDDEAVNPHTVYPNQHVLWNPMGYSVSAVSSRLAFQILHPEGRVILSQTPVEPVPFRPDKRALWEEAMDEHRIGEPMYASHYPEVPEEKPVFHRLIVGKTGEIWLRMSTPSDPDVMEAVRTFPGYPPSPQWKEPVFLAAFDSLGRFLKGVVGTSADEIQAAVGDTLWGIRTGDYDEEYVVRLLVEELPSGG